jgi:hypothetical protein
VSLLVAFEVAYGERKELVFAISAAHAKEQFTQRYGVPPVEAPRCVRAAWADIFAEAGVVPAFERLQHGYRVCCTQCGEAISASGSPVYAGDHAFCSSACQKRWDSETFDLGQSCEEAGEVALLLWPKARIIAVQPIDGRPRVHFAFGSPGRHAFWFADADEVQVAPVDLEHWQTFNAQMKALRSF